MCDAQAAGEMVQISLIGLMLVAESSLSAQDTQNLSQI